VEVDVWCISSTLCPKRSSLFLATPAGFLRSTPTLLAILVDALDLLYR